MIPVRRSIVVVLTLGVVLGMVAPGAALAPQQSTDESAANIPTPQTPDVANDGVTDTQVFDVSNDGQIQAWERASLTLRTDDTGAPTTIPVPATVQLQKLGGDTFSEGNDGTESKSLVQEFGDERNPIGVHNSGESVTLSFRSDYATGGTYDGLNDQKRVDIVAARLTPQDGKGVPKDTDEAFDLLSDVENANANASFEMLRNGARLDSSGNIDVKSSYSPGHYVIFAAVHEEKHAGFETDAENNISVDGDVTIIGMEQLAIQENQASVDAPNDPEPGDTLTFEVDASGTFGPSEQVTHAVAVYNASTFENARFDLVVDQSELGTDFTVSEDAELEHSINEVNGVADVEDGLTLNGNDLSDGEVRRPVDASSVIDFLADEGGVNEPLVNPITNGGESDGEYERIDASVTAINGANHVVDVDVDTFENFSEGTYRYVTVSTLDSNESQMSTDSGTFTLEEGDSDSGSDDSGGGGGGGGGGSDDVEPPTDTDPVVKPPVQQEGNSSSATVLSVEANETISLDIPATANTNESTSLEQLNVTSTEDAGGVRISVTSSSRPTDGTPENDRGTETLSYLNVSTKNLPNADRSPGTFRFRVSPERLEELGSTPSNVVMYRYNDGSWNAIETTYLGNNRYRATTPGYSWFAISTADASISVTDASLSATATETGDSVDVTATVENSGDVAGNVTLTLTADGDDVDSRTISVGAGSTTTESFEFSSGQAGDYELSINGVSAGTLSVSQPDTGTETPTDTPTEPSTEPSAGTETGTSDGTPDGGSGGGSPLLIIGILVVVLILFGAIGYQANK